MMLTGLKTLCGVALAFGSLSSASVLGCGINWSKPKFYFDSINERGYVSYWEKIGNVKMGKEEIPIHLHFLSNRKSSSPYAGYGWSVPLLESRMEQVSENAFRLWQPEGRFRDFGRDSNSPNLLHGQAGWKAEIKGDTIQAYADCGWKLGFKGGRIISLGTPEGKSYRYQYQDGLVKSIKEEGSGLVVVDVIRDPSDEAKITLAIGQEKIVLEQGEKPRIERLMKQNLVGGMDQSLVRIVKADEEVRDISYDVDLQDIVPTFAPEKDRKLTMDPVTGIIVSDKDWTYTIEQDQEVSWNNAAITRVNSQKEEEFWHKNQVKGEKTIRTSDGKTIFTSWFNSGELAGKTRKIVILEGQEEVSVEKSIYNEQGKLVKKLLSTDGVTRFVEVSQSIPVELPSMEDLKYQEKILKSAIADPKSSAEKIYELAMLYAGGQLSQPEKARLLAVNLTNSTHRFNVLLHSYDHDPDLSPTEKIRAYQKLKDEFPDRNDLLNKLIKIRKGEA